MSSDDELDYMSSEFLENRVKDVRPGLILSHSHRRYHNIYKKKHVIDEKSTEQQRPKKLVESKGREEGLKNTKGETKGFGEPTQANMSSDNELDYMSAEILKNCAKEDTRPSLIHSHSHKRYHDIHKQKQVRDEKNRPQQRPTKSVESKRREEGLKEAIGGGKGFGKPTQANLSSDDELDYMSAEILENCVKEDVRPGLIYSHSHKRYHDIHKKKQVTDEENRQRHRPKKVVESERRDEGLKEAIGGENKGFALLQKMGYKPGTAIGKSGTGRTEPVPINIKAGREGLGRETALKEIAEEKLKIRRRLALQREKECNPDDYRARMMKKVAERQIEADLRKSQRICENLDQAMCIDEPAETFFWPTPKNQPSEAEDDEDYEEEGSQEQEENEEEDEEEEDQEMELERMTRENSQQLFHVTTTLNNFHTEESNMLNMDLNMSCPEPRKPSRLHYDPPEKLEILTLYLRRTYNYCIWCAVQYDDEKDLQESCPGPTRDDHE